MRKLVIGMAMASTALTSPAVAREGQWYIEGTGGVMLVEDQAIDVGAAADNAAANYDTGYDFGASVGYDFGAFRLEAETSYRAADLGDVQAGTLGLALNPVQGGFSTFTGTREALGEANALSFMLNGLFDFGSDDGFQAFAGGGIGVARVDMDGRVNANGPGVWNDSDTGLAWQLLAGVRAPLSDSWDVGLRYRYFNVPTVNLVDPLGRDLETKFNSHSLLGSITYNFGGAEPPPPPVVVPVAPPPPPPPPPPRPVAPPPPPKVACNTGPYIVFFDFDKSDITPAAANILNSAVTAYANCGTASVMLAGHTDRAGSPKYNVGLAERRNAAVSAYLTGRGIPAARISGQAFGETMPKVATADGVREAQNRRVEVTYGPGSGM
jgi:outer membrane protein OmpA-like peptidoglycan-associated protein